jgi:hypothetical protein
MPRHTPPPLTLHMLKNTKTVNANELAICWDNFLGGLTSGNKSLAFGWRWSRVRRRGRTSHPINSNFIRDSADILDKDAEQSER